MTKIDNIQIQKIAKLSRISFNDNEAETFANQVSDIISWVNKLDEVETKDVVTMMSIDDKLTMRDEKVDIQNDANQILQNCTDKQYSFYAVPKFIE